MLKVCVVLGPISARGLSGGMPKGALGSWRLAPSIQQVVITSMAMWLQWMKDLQR